MPRVDWRKVWRLWNSLALLCCLGWTAACSRDMPSARSEATIVEPRPAVALLPPKPAPRKAAPVDPFKVTAVLDLDQPLRHGDYAWNDEGAPDNPLKVVVDVEAEVIYVYRGGVEIGRAAVLYGADDKPTPLGLYPILEKDRDHVSNLYGAPMPYMLRLTWDGISIHGSEVEYGYATNGCIGVPDDFAALLFATARKGDQVLITKDWQVKATA